jgi:DNA (cytosine-5)-methyltransferase 1
MRTLSLFTGAGGMDYGFEAAGFKTVCAIEMDSDCVATLNSNREWPVIQRDISGIEAEDINSLRKYGHAGIDVIIGGPPCQPFSKSTYWHMGDSYRMSDGRANTLGEYMRFVEKLMPEVFVLENVYGIAYTGKEEGFQFLQNRIADLNKRRGVRYSCSWKVLNAADFGVPQIRQRFFLVGHRDGIPFMFPAPTHTSNQESNGQGTLVPDLDQPAIRAWDAIGDIEDAACDLQELNVRGKWSELLASIPEGENYLWHTEKRGGLPIFGWRRHFWNFLLKLSKRQPSWTLQANPGPAVGPFHWKNRRLSVKEMLRIQTFPSDVEIFGAYRNAQKQIGNAVPSLLAEVIARGIAQQYFNGHYSSPPKLSICRKYNPPPPEPLSPVPEKYLQLVGRHAPHPGTGGGYLYRAKEAT